MFFYFIDRISQNTYGNSTTHLVSPCVSFVQLNYPYNTNITWGTKCISNYRIQRIQKRCEWKLQEIVHHKSYLTSPIIVAMLSKAGNILAVGSNPILGLDKCAILIYVLYSAGKGLAIGRTPSKDFYQMSIRFSYITNSTALSPWEAASCPATQELPHSFKEPEDLLSCSQQPSTDP
jgi:hypothetical protein